MDSNERSNGQQMAALRAPIFCPYGAKVCRPFGAVNAAPFGRQMPPPTAPPTAPGGASLLRLSGNPVVMSSGALLKKGQKGPKGPKFTILVIET